MANYQEFTMYLKDAITHLHLAQDGQIKVCPAGTKPNAATYDVDGVLQTSTRPTMDFTDGKMAFRTLASVGNVDVYIYTEKGYYAQIMNISAGSVGDVNIDTQRLNQTLVYPFSYLDSGQDDANQYDTKIKLADKSRILPWGICVDVTDVASTETLSVGTEAATGEDNDGFIALLSLTTAGIVIPQVGFDSDAQSVAVDLTGAAASAGREYTLGALFNATSSDGTFNSRALSEGAVATAGGSGVALLVPHIANVQSQEYLTYILTTGSDALHAEGIISLPVLNPYPRY